MGAGMVDKLDTSQVEFRIIGKPELKNRVLGSVFARKLGVLIRAMGAADKTANGGKRFDYVIIDMKATSASATLSEQRVSKIMPQDSSVHAFGECLLSVNSGNFAAARRHPECALYLRALAVDVEDTFSHAELTVNGFQPVIVDKFFLNRASEAIAAEASAEIPTWFKGSAVGTFDGQIKETDLRGSIPKVIIRLTAGGKDIDCVCPGLTVEDIRSVLDKRVRMTGSAFYDGKSGLPVRIEVTSVPVLVKQPADFTRWRGAFEPFDPELWSGNN
jgi:hypothetical protein